MAAPTSAVSPSPGGRSVAGSTCITRSSARRLSSSVAMPTGQCTSRSCGNTVSGTTLSFSATCTVTLRAWRTQAASTSSASEPLPPCSKRIRSAISEGLSEDRRAVEAESRSSSSR